MLLNGMNFFLNMNKKLLLAWTIRTTDLATPRVHGACANVTKNMNASQPMSLEDSSFSYILLNFECFSPDHVALLPTGIRARLFLHLPLADLCKLEGTPAVAGIDMNQVWHEAATDACKLKGNSISEVEARLMLPVKVYGIDTT